MEIKHSDYQVTYDSKTNIITCAGTFRLRGSEYTPVIELLTTVAKSQPPTITLDLYNLQFLNSSGINTLSKFVIQVRKLKTSLLTVTGNKASPWQRKSLKNFKRLLPTLQLNLVD